MRATTTTAACVPDLLRVAAGAEPDEVALSVDGGDGLTFRRWEERSNAVARGLAAHGVRRGDRVALLFDNPGWLDYAVCYVAVHKAGAAAVPLSSRFSPGEVAGVLAHCEPRLAVADPALAPALADARPVLTPGEVTAGQSEAPFQAAFQTGDLAEILYTSGTTGTPKGVACSHDSIVFLDLPPDTPAGDGRRSIVHAFPIGTNAAQELLRAPLRRPGVTAIVVSAFDPDRLGRVVAEHRVRRLQLVPAMAEVLVSSGAPTRHDLSSVERVTLSSAPTPPALVGGLRKAFPGASVWIAYALTESGSARTLACCGHDWRGSVGRPVGGAEVRVVDDSGRDVPAGETGEIWLRRPGAPPRWYYRDADATAAAWVECWLRTGDVGYLDDGGELYLVDRAKDLIISGGLNVSSLEVESVLAEHPAVRQAAVFGLPHAVLGQDVAAAVVPAEPVTERELQAFVRARLAEAKVPHRLFVVDEIPLGPSGKPLKRVLRQRFARPEPAPEAIPAATDTERAVAAVWSEVLGTPELGAEADFFALGGHSLAAVQIAARLEDAFGVPLPVTAVFEWPTVRELAAAVDERRVRDGR